MQAPLLGTSGKEKGGHTPLYHTTEKLPKDSGATRIVEFFLHFEILS